jgi:5-methylcytosine-specific restriction endonuclease McrA
MMAFVRGSQYDKFYKTARWKQLRKLQLTQFPLCKFCLEHGIVEPATVVDHVMPHKGNWTEFVTGELQSLCEPCHKSAKRQVELHGYRFDVGLEGFPTDPNHPWYRAR